MNPNRYKSPNYVVLDFETTNLDKGDCRNKDNSTVCVGYQNWVGGVLSHKEVIRGGEWDIGRNKKFRQAIEDADFCVAHNSKFEFGWLRRCGVDISSILFFCTQIAEYVLAGNRRWELKLDSIANKRLGTKKDSLVSLMIKSGVCPSEIPYQSLKKYCAKDCELTNKIFLQQLKELDELSLLPVMYTRCIATPVLVDIESRGMHLDKKQVTETHINYEREYNSLMREISEFTGGINLNSTKQVAELLYERLGFSELKDRRGNTLTTATGKRKTDAGTITLLKANNKSQRRFLELFKLHGKLEAALSKNLRFFQGVVDETKDCIFYANLNQTITQTHRLSSTGKAVKFELFGGKKKGIQIQNIPRQFKPLFTAREEDWLLGEIDGAQLEFRVAAFLGQDRRASKDIVQGVDVHERTAQSLTKAGESTSRQEAKSRTFKPLYGGTSGTKAEREYYSEFKERYSGITDAQEDWKEEVERTKELRTVTGLRFYWPDTKWEGSSRNPYLRNTTSICNYPVQMFATADIIPIAITIMWYLMRKNKLLSYIVNTIHDSGILEIHPDEREIISEIGELSFNRAVKGYLAKVYNIDFNVPLAAELKIGTCWNG